MCVTYLILTFLSEYIYFIEPFIKIWGFFPQICSHFLGLVAFFFQPVNCKIPNKCLGLTNSDVAFL